MLKTVRLKPRTPMIIPDKLNPVRKPDIAGFRKTLASKDPLRSISAFFRFEDIAVSKERDLLVYDDALSLLQLLADKHAPKISDVKQILTIMKQLNLPKTIDIYNAYLKVLVKNNDFRATRNVMQEMKDNGLDLNTESYVAIIQAFEDDKHFHGILEFVDSIKSEGLLVNEEIYRHLLNVALKDTKNFNNFEYVLKIVDDLGYINHPRIVDVILKYKISKFGLEQGETFVTQLLELEDYNVEAKSRVLCILLNGFLSNKKYDMVLHYLKFMKDKEFMIYKKAFHIEMDCLFQMGKAQEALQVFEEMKEKGLEADQFTYLHLITGLCQNNDLVKAAELFHIFHTLDLPRLGPIYRALLEAYCERNLAKDAETLFKYMITHGIHVSEAIYNIIFRLASNTMNMDLMQKYWRLMTVEAAGIKNEDLLEPKCSSETKSRRSMTAGGAGIKNEDPLAPKYGSGKVALNFQPSSESFSIYISLFLKCHRLEEANEKFQEMIDAGRDPCADILGNLLESNILARNFGGAARTIQWMRKYSSNTSELSTKIKDYIHSRSVEFESIIHDLHQPLLSKTSENMADSMESSSKRELIISIYNELQIVRIKLSEKTFQLLMTIYDEQRDFVNVVKVWTQLLESKVKPSTETINILLRSAKKYGRQRTIRALISFFEKEKDMKLNFESFRHLLSMAASFGMISEIRYLILEMENHDIRFTPSLYNEMEDIFKENPIHWKVAYGVRDFVEEYFPEAIFVSGEEEAYEADTKAPEWFKNGEDQKQA